MDSGNISDGDILMALRALNESRLKDQCKLRAYTNSLRYALLEFGAEARHENAKRWRWLKALLTTSPLEYNVVRDILHFVYDLFEDDEFDFAELSTTADAELSLEVDGVATSSCGVTSITKEQFMKKELARLLQQAREVAAKAPTDLSDSSTSAFAGEALSKSGTSESISGVEPSTLPSSTVPVQTFAGPAGREGKRNLVKGFGTLMAQLAAVENKIEQSGTDPLQVPCDAAGAFAADMGSPGTSRGSETRRARSSEATSGHAQRRGISSAMLQSGIRALKKRQAPKASNRCSSEVRKNTSRTCRPMSLNEELRARLRSRFAGAKGKNSRRSSFESDSGSPITSILGKCATSETTSEAERENVAPNRAQPAAGH
jgi:hypothetical protein